MFPNLNFDSRVIAVEPGDLLAVTGDGFVEVANSESEEFRLDAVKDVVVSNATDALSRIVDRLVEEAADFGERQDDQSTNRSFLSGLLGERLPHETV
jgi:serine phosphatase RsbU (regulator of sigma subunit)